MGTAGSANILEQQGVELEFPKYVLPQAPRHRPPDTETGKGLSQIGVDKASNAQVPLNSVTGILICLNFLSKVCACSDAFKEFLSLELRRKFKTRHLPPGFHDLSSTSNSMCRKFLPKVNARNDAPNPKKASE